MILSVDNASPLIQNIQVSQPRIIWIIPTSPQVLQPSNVRSPADLHWVGSFTRVVIVLDVFQMSE